MQQWVVGGAVVEREGRILLVRNVRRDGRVDWSTPGGVIDPGESVLGGLTREVEEETGLRVTGWHGPLYEVAVAAPGLRWQLRVEVHRAVGFEGEVVVDDPDGIVAEARWVDAAGCAALLASSWLPTREPLTTWMAEGFSDGRCFSYTLDGAERSTARVLRC